MNDSPSTVEQAFIGGLVGAGVAIASLLPPILQFVSGPLGPLIGGVVAGAKYRATGIHALVAGLTIGVLLALVVPVLATLLKAILPVVVPTEALVAVGVIVFLYSTALGTAGAWMGGRIGQASA
jgi:hypothetical protein